MNARLATAIVASIGLALAGCNGGGQARTIHGQINVADYGLHQPVVLVESSNHLSYVAQVAANGSFRISVPSGQSYRLTLSDRTSAGPLALASHILWTSNGQNFVWAKVQQGATINFGLIRPMNAPHTSPTSPAPAPSVGEDQGENDDSQCDEDDDAQGDEQGPTGTTATCQPPMTPPSNPPVCMPGGSGGMGNSTGDQDENCDQDNNAQGDDDRDGNGGSGAQCSDGGMSGDDNNQGDDNAQGNEDEDDGNGSGCVKHVPTCPPAGGSGGSGGGMATPDMGPPPPPPASPDMSTGGSGPIG